MTKLVNVYCKNFDTNVRVNVTDSMSEKEIENIALSKAVTIIYGKNAIFFKNFGFPTINYGQVAKTISGSNVDATCLTGNVIIKCIILN